MERTGLKSLLIGVPTARQIVNLLQTIAVKD